MCLNRSGRGAGRSKAGTPCAAIQTSASDAFTMFEAARVNPTSRLPSRIIKRTANEIPVSVTTRRTRSATRFFQATRSIAKSLACAVRRLEANVQTATADAMVESALARRPAEHERRVVAATKADGVHQRRAQLPLQRLPHHMAKALAPFSWARKVRSRRYDVVLETQHGDDGLQAWGNGTGLTQTTFD